jgi:HEAT repeat protein
MRDLKRRVLSILQSEDFAERLDELCRVPARQAINPLFSFLLNNDELTKWRAVTAMGEVVSRLADTNMESARVIVRRLMWSLNDESGGIGWGAPEAMGEIIARHEGLANEYAKVLISYIWEEGNYLEYDMLQRGAVWGVGRAARARTRLMQDAEPYLIPFLGSPDAYLRGLAAWALGPYRSKTAVPYLEALLHDTAEISIYVDAKLLSRPVKKWAEQALAADRKPLQSNP